MGIIGNAEISVINHDFPVEPVPCVFCPGFILTVVTTQEFRG
jgi:hypothetical protein